MPAKRFPGQKKRLFAHRGASGECPENTIPAFEKALSDGANILEMDVRSTSDGHLVIIHDAELERTTNGTGEVSERTLSDIEGLDAGKELSPECAQTDPCKGKAFKVPTLEDVIKKFPGIPFNIEIKQRKPRIEIQVVDLLEKLGHEEITLLASKKRSILKHIRAHNSKVLTNFSVTEVLKFLARVWLNWWKGYVPPGDALQIAEKLCGIRIVTPKFIEAAHHPDRKLEVHVWTVNEKSDMRRLLKMGVDGIMTDYPARLTEVVNELGY